MVKFYGAAFTLIAQTGVAVSDASTFEKVLTQGGLFAVCIILLYMIQQQQKQMQERQLAVQLKLEELRQEDKNSLNSLTALISSSVLALTRLEASNQQLVRTLDKLEQRRAPREH